MDFSSAKIHIFRKTARTSILFQFDLLIAAKLKHLVPDVVFEALDVLLVRPTIDEVDENA